MSLDYFYLLEIGIWSGISALGFGILFNIPKKTTLTVFFLGLLGGIIKFILIEFELNIILASLVAASAIGFASIRLAHLIHYSPAVFAIPPIIPMIPGFYAYQTLIAVMKYTLLNNQTSAERLLLLEVIFHNGFTMLFILTALILGVSLPMLILRKTTVKERK